MKLIERNARPIGFGLILLGLCLFCNPVLAGVDVLPDSIGCLLILLGLKPLSLINRQIAQTKTAFYKLLAFCICKDIGVLIMLGMATGAERPAALLMVAFLSSVLGYFFCFSAFHALFEGFYALSVLRDCKALYGKHRQLRLFGWQSREYSRPELALRYSLVCLALRDFFAVLPEFSALTTSSFDDSAWDHLYDYIGVMRAFCAFFALIAGIVWLVALLRFFSALKREYAFRTRLGEDVAEWKEAHPGSAISRRFGISFLLLTIGAVFLADFRLDFHNVLPDAIAACLLVAGALTAPLERNKKLILSLSFTAFGALATLSEHYAFSFVSQFNPSAISKTEEAASAYFTMWGTALIEFLVFLGALAVLLFFLHGVIVKWAGYQPTHEDLAFEQRRRTAYVEEFDRELIRVFIFGFIAALASFLYDYVQEIPNIRIFRLMEYFWGIDLILSVLFAVMLGSLLSAIHREIEGRFEYEGCV